MQVSQLMQIDMSIRSGTFCHFGLRVCVARRPALLFGSASAGASAVVSILVSLVPIATSLSVSVGGALCTVRRVSTYPFLSPEWVEAAKAVRDEYAERLPPPPLPMKANVVVTQAPFGSDTIAAFVDTSAGQLTLDLGHLDDAELTIRIEYAVAKRLFVERDQAAAMEGFMTGRIVVEGDLTKVMALQAQQVDPVAEEVAARIDELTASD
jgi:hypothetical protein